MTTVVTGYGFLDSRGYGGSLLAGMGPHAPEDPLRPWVGLPHPSVKRFGRLDSMSKCAVVATELVGLDASKPPAPRPDLAIVLGTQFGCLEVDLDFHASMGQPGGGSPLLFMFTLPSTAMGEVSIQLKAMGPNQTIMAGPESGLTALWESLDILALGEASSCVCLLCDAAPTHGHLTAGIPELGEVFSYGYALLLENTDTAKIQERRALAEVESKMTSFPSLCDVGPSALARLCRWLTQKGQKPELALSHPFLRGKGPVLCFRPIV